MAKKKSGASRLVLLLIALVVLVGLALLLLDPLGWRQPSAEEQAAADPTQRVLCDFSKDDIRALGITKPGETMFKLELADGKWYVAQGDRRYRANMERVDKFLEELPGLRSQGLATDKLDKHSQFEVDSTKAIQLSVWTGGEEPVVELLVGKADPSYQGCYVRLGEGVEVYRAGKNVKSLVGFAFNDYRNRKPWDFDPAQVTEVTVAPPSGEGAALTFARQDNLWKTPAGTNANQNLLNELLKKISELSIGQFIDEPDPAIVHLEGVAPNLVFKVPGGEYRLTIGGKESTNYYVADQDGDVYQIGDYYLKPYTEIAFDQLTFDDTPKEAAADAAAQGETQPDEGVADGLPSDKDEGGK